jgi:formate/nitrite transporter FocA (FNT family)
MMTRPLRQRVGSVHCDGAHFSQVFYTYVRITIYLCCNWFVCHTVTAYYRNTTSYITTVCIVWAFLAESYGLPLEESKNTCTHTYAYMQLVLR